MNTDEQNTQAASAQFDDLAKETDELDRRVTADGTAIIAEAEKIADRIKKTSKEIDQICAEIGYVEKKANDEIDRIILEEIGQMTDSDKKDYSKGGG